jgi:hypothetical protein
MENTKIPPEGTSRKKRFDDWGDIKNRFIDAHNGDVEKAAITLCRRMYVSKLKTADMMAQYQEMLTGARYTPTYVYRIMCDFCHINKIQMVKNEYAHKFVVLRQFCIAQGINTPLQEPTCVWTPYDDDGDTWEGSCGALWVMIEGTPKENKMNFCPQCGKRLEEHVPEEEEDEE